MKPKRKTFGLGSRPEISLSAHYPVCQCVLCAKTSAESEVMKGLNSHKLSNRILILIPDVAMFPRSRDRKFQTIEGMYSD